VSGISYFTELLATVETSATETFKLHLNMHTDAGKNTRLSNEHFLQIFEQFLGQLFIENSDMDYYWP
jgi:hypothetical protein